MGYRRKRGYSSNRGRYYAQRHLSAAANFSSGLAGIDRDIKQIFLSLPKAKLESLFLEYGYSFGSNPEKYARKTYPKWKSGEVGMSGQTAARLIELLPPQLSNEVRAGLVKKLWLYHQKKQNTVVRTTPATWRDDLLPSVRGLINASGNFRLPDAVLAKATWLSNGDSQAVQVILAAAEQEEAALRLAYLDAEMKRIELLVADIDADRRVNHSIELPQGTIALTIEMPARSLFEKLKSWWS